MLGRLYVSGAEGKAFMSCLLETQLSSALSFVSLHPGLGHEQFAFIHTVAIVIYSLSRANKGRCFWTLEDPESKQPLLHLSYPRQGCHHSDEEVTETAITTPQRSMSRKDNHGKGKSTTM